MHTLLKNNISSSRPTVIGLLRHGKTVWNEEQRIQGRHDSPLSENGREQVNKWARFLEHYSIDHIISSDLGRVRETVNIILRYKPDIPVEYTHLLREQSWGKWEGSTFPQLNEHHADELAEQISAGWNFRPPGGESRTEVLERSLPVIQDTLQRFSGKNILIVSHEGIVKSVIYRLTKRAFMPDEKKIIQKRQLHLLYARDHKLEIGPLNVFPTSLEK